MAARWPRRGRRWQLGRRAGLPAGLLRQDGFELRSAADTRGHAKLLLRKAIAHRRSRRWLTGARERVARRGQADRRLFDRVKDCALASGMLLARRRAAVLSLSALLAFPAAASATPFKDKVHHRHARPRLAGPGQRRSATRPATARISIPVTLARSYTGDPAVAQTYATFLGTLPHGPELASLKVTVVPSSEIATRVRRRAGRRHPRLLRRRRPDDDRPGRPGGRQRRSRSTT